MIPYDVEIAPRARRELHRLAAWWEEQAARPGIVAEELAEAIELLSLFPEIGASYPFSKRPGVRRRLLSQTQIYVYYRVIEASRLVQIIAFWHTARRRGPRL